MDNRIHFSLTFDTILSLIGAGMVVASVIVLTILGNIADTFCYIVLSVYFSFVCKDRVQETPHISAHESEQQTEEKFPRSASSAPSSLSVGACQLISPWETGEQQDQRRPVWPWGHGQVSVRRMGG